MKKICLSLLALVFGLSWAQDKKDDHAFKVMKQLEIFNEAITELDQYYVDTLDVEKKLTEAIHYVMSSVDPYTEYYPESDSHVLKEMRTGKYAGIGSPIYYRPDLKRCVFNSPYFNMPAGKAGLRTGDIVLRIDSLDMTLKDGEDSQDFLSRVTDHLRGEAGSSFQLYVKRPFVKDSLLTFTLTRQMIVQPSVPFTYMTADSIGYIRLQSFIENTTAEFKRAFMALKQQGMKQLVIDLSQNGGGLMDEAVNLVGLFVPRGTKVVETKSKMTWIDEVSLTSEQPIDTQIPIAVMVDGATASAAEITSGALQDYDRAVIIGDRTYGKGLVQTTRQLPYNTSVKLTVSRYIIPSGRCVQAYKYENGRPVYQADSLAKTFYTQNGRPVKDGGGIMPDIEALDTLVSNVAAAIDGSLPFSDFCVRYRNTHDRIAPAKDFRLTEEEYESFKTFMLESDFKFQSNSNRILDLLKEAAKREDKTDFEASAEFKAIQEIFKPNLELDLIKNKAVLKELLEMRIIAMYYDSKGVFEYFESKDKAFQSALGVLRDSKTYHEILSGKKK